MEVIEIKENQKTLFNEFVQENGTFLQSFQWGEFKGEFGWRPYRLVITDNNKWVLAASVLVKKLFFSKSFIYIPEGPIASLKVKSHPPSPRLRSGLRRDAPRSFSEVGQKSNLKTYLETLFTKIREIAQKENAICLKIEPFFKIPEIEKSGFVKSFEDIQPGYRLWVDLTQSEEQILREMKHKGRYNIKIAENHGVSISKSSDDNMLDKFYTLHLQTAKRDKFSARPKKYFGRLLEIFKQGNSGGLFLAIFEDVLVAAAIVSFWGRYAAYLYGASSRLHQKTMASYLLHWQIIKAAKKRGCAFYDFGAIAPDDNPKHVWAGLRQFKTKFGGEEIHLPGCYDLVYQKTAYRIFKILEKLRRKL